MGINTISQAFEKTEKRREVIKMRYKIGLCLSLGLNIILIVFTLSTVSTFQNSKSASNVDLIEKELLFEKTLKELHETNEVLTEVLLSEIPKLINQKTYPKTIMSTKRLTKKFE